MANADYFLSNFPGLGDLAHQLMGQFNAMSTCQGDLKTNVNRVLADRQGPAYQEFLAAAGKMDSIIAELAGILSGSSTFYTTSQQNGQATELASLKGWSTLLG